MKSKLLLALFVFFSLIYFQAKAAETEPNNLPTQASTLPLNGSNTGIINPVGDMDWYKITTNGDGLITLQLTALSGVNTYFALYDTTGNILLTQNYTSGTYAYSYDGLAKGTYYVKVFPYSATDTSSYIISNTFTAAPVANDNEPDSTVAQANTLPLSGSVTGHVGYYFNNHRDTTDWYKLTTVADGAITLNLVVSNNTNVYFDLYDTNGKIVLYSNYTSGDYSYTVDGLAKGVYYVKVHCYDNNQFAPYTLKNTFTAPTPANDAEPDSTVAQALTLPLSGSVTGHIGYYTNNHRDTLDWYKLTTVADGAVTLNLIVANNTNVYFDMYDTDGKIVLYSNYTSGDYSYTVDGLAKGVYYVKVHCYDNNQFAPYTLKNTFAAPAQANDAEPDSTVAQALTLPLSGSVTGHIGYYTNNHRDTLDWYKLTTVADGAVTLNLSVANNTYVYFDMYDTDGKIVLYSNYTSGDYSYTVDGLAKGIYYIKVYNYYNYQFAPYTLKNTFTAPAQANDTEPDSTVAQALTLPLNDSVTGHIGYYNNNHKDSTDWYKLTTNADGAISLTLIVANNKYVYFNLYDHDGTTLLHSDYTSGNYTYTIDGLAKGTYYVKVNNYYSNEFAPYTLKNILTTYNPNDSLPNDHPYMAATMPANRTTTGHVGFYYNQMRDTLDWHKINYTGTGDLALTLKTLPWISGGYHYTYMQVYKDTSAAPIFSDYYATDMVKINLTGLAQGYYYIKVYCYYSGEFEAYSITDSFTQVNIAAIVLKTKTAANSCGANNIVYKLSGSHAPYSVKLFHNGVAYDSAIAVTDTIKFANLPHGNYYATVYGDGATDSAYGKSVSTQFLPPYPINLTTTNIGVHTATLNWSPLTCAKYYRLQYRVKGSSTWTTIDNKATTGSLYTLAGLTPYTTYAWHVAAVDSAQGQQIVSAYSDSTLFLTLSDTAHITLVKLAAGKTCNSDTLQYKLTNSAAPYTVQLYRYGVVYGTAISTTDTAKFTGLAPGVYVATATGTGSGGSLGTSDTAEFAPPVTMALYTDSLNASNAMLNWAAQSCATSFTVQYRVKNAVTWTTVNTAANSTGYYLSGLQPSTTYEWHVASVASAPGFAVTSNYSVSDTFTTTSIFPITLAGFSGKIVSSTVQLSWQTLTEINSKNFEILRSSDGFNFSSIGVVNTRGDFGIQSYNFTDNQPLQGNNFYRLKMVDKDGSFAYSTIINFVVISNGSFFTMYPNPATNVLHISTFSAAPATAIVYDMQGKVVLTQQLNGSAISNQINVSRLAAGTYTIVLLQDKNKQTGKFIKQ